MRDALTRNGISNAEVESIEGLNIGRGIRTDSTGSYRLDGLVEGNVTIRASADGYAAQTTSVSLNSNQSLNFDLSKPQATAFRYFGVVRDGLGNPVPRTTVRSGTGDCQFSTVTDASGRYDGMSTCSSIVFAVQPPEGYEGALPQFQSSSPAGERNFTTKRIVGVTLTAPSQIAKSDGTLFFSVGVSVRFDDGTTRRLGSQDFVVLQSSNANIVRTRGADGNNLTIEGVSVGTASITATYWTVASAPVMVTVT